MGGHWNSACDDIRRVRERGGQCVASALEVSIKSSGSSDEAGAGLAWRRDYVMPQYLVTSGCEKR